MVYIYIFYSPQAQVYSEIVYIFCLHLKLWRFKSSSEPQDGFEIV